MQVPEAEVDVLEYKLMVIEHMSRRRQFSWKAVKPFFWQNSWGGTGNSAGNVRKGRFRCQWGAGLQLKHTDLARICMHLFLFALFIVLVNKENSLNQTIYSYPVVCCNANSTCYSAWLFKGHCWCFVLWRGGNMFKWEGEALPGPWKSHFHKTSNPIENKKPTEKRPYERSDPHGKTLWPCY